jgi:putative transcription factor
MNNCEMCGTQSDNLVKARIEGAELKVCDSCTRFGEPLEEPETEEDDKPKLDKDGSDTSPDDYRNFSSEEEQQQSGPFKPQVEELVFDYDDRIRNGREEADLSQEELANKLNEKQSLLHRLEKGKALPSEEVRQKLEQALEIELTAAGGQ